MEAPTLLKFLSLAPKFHPGAKGLHFQLCLFLLLTPILPQAPWPGP